MRTLKRSVGLVIDLGDIINGFEIQMLSPNNIAAQGGELAEAFSTLLSQLSDHPRIISEETLLRIAEEPHTHQFVGRNEGRVVAIFSAVIYTVPTRKVMVIEDVVVDLGYRKRGFGEAMTEFAIKFAKENQVQTIDLTSRPDRLAANRMYEKNGFIKRETNCFRYNLPA